MSEQEQDAPIGNAEAARIMVRAFRYMAPFKSRLFVKILFTLLSNVPMLLLPWPVKILVDHVIAGREMSDTPTNYPFFLDPFIGVLDGKRPATIALIIGGVISVMLVVVGAWGVGGRDQTGAGIANGTDIATRSENDANMAWSYSGGVFGWIDYRWTLRLTHSINHYFRSRLFESVQRLPMTRLDDQRIGDAVYRVMYDTPAISEVCFRLVLTPIVTPVAMLLPIWVMSLSYGNVPVVIWTAISVVAISGFLVLGTGTSRNRKESAVCGGIRKI